MQARTLGRVAALLAAAALVLITAPAVLAKEGVSVELMAPLPRDAEPGTKVPAFFTMVAIDNDVVSPLKTGQPFIRLYGPTGAMTEAIGVRQDKPELYKALIEIPAGGVSRADFGVHGKATAASGRVVATDPLWAYDGVLLTAAIPAPVGPNAYKVGQPATNGQPATAAAPVTQTGAATSPGLDPRLAILAALVIAALAGGGAYGLRHRGRAASTAI
jgi:hypothetical protein